MVFVGSEQGSSEGRDGPEGGRGCSEELLPSMADTFQKCLCTRWKDPQAWSRCVAYELSPLLWRGQGAQAPLHFSHSDWGSEVFCCIFIDIF